MRNILFLAISDTWYQLRQGSTLVWLFIMPPVFFYFVGTVTGGFSSGAGTRGAAATPITVIAESAGHLQEQLDLRLRDNDFAPVWLETASTEDAEPAPRRLLTFSKDLSAAIVAGQKVNAVYDSKASSLTRDFEIVRLQRSLYTALADIVVAKADGSGAVSATELATLNDRARIWTLEVSPAGKRKTVPSGFQQSVPGFLVMFTLLILLTSGGSMLVLERKQGLLRRLASAPLGRPQIVSGKWLGRMALATIQVASALLVGSLLFQVDWGPDFAMVLLVLTAWAGFCASAGLLLGSLANTEAQASGFGVLAANALAALGGCWWPIEVTPTWMQMIQKVTPTGWTMDALHKLMSFQSGAASVIPELLLLSVATIGIVLYAVKRFQYQ